MADFSRYNDKPIDPSMSISSPSNTIQGVPVDQTGMIQETPPKFQTHELLQQQQLATEMSDYMQMPQDSRDTQWELSADDLILDLSHIMKGHIKTQDGKWKEREGFALMNDKGINDCVVIPLQITANKNMFLSNIPEERTFYFIKMFRIRLTRLIGFNHDKYGMQKAHRDYILDLIVSFVAAALFRPMDGGERKGRWSTEKRSYIYAGEAPSQTQNKQKKGLFGLGAFGL